MELYYTEVVSRAQEALQHQLYEKCIQIQNDFCWCVFWFFSILVLQERIWPCNVKMKRRRQFLFNSRPIWEKRWGRVHWHQRFISYPSVFSSFTNRDDNYLFLYYEKKNLQGCESRVVFILNLKNRIFSLEKILGCFFKRFFGLVSFSKCMLYMKKV